MFKSYSELIKLPDFKSRVTYLQTDSRIGDPTLGGMRYLIEKFYNSDEWRHIRDQMIMRDRGHDLALEDPTYEILGVITIHHINPITRDDILRMTPIVTDPENLVCVSELPTHRLIHYGGEIVDPYVYIERTPHDTCPWKN